SSTTSPLPTSSGWRRCGSTGSENSRARGRPGSSPRSPGSPPPSTSSYRHEAESAVKLRTPTVEDLPALTRFFPTLNEMYGSGGEPGAELRAWLESPIFDPAADFRVATAENGLVGWCDVWDQNRMRSRFFADVRAHPRTATVYAALLDWAEG